MTEISDHSKLEILDQSEKLRGLRRVVGEYICHQDEARG
jgi:hypothetical protein